MFIARAIRSFAILAVLALPLGGCPGGSLDSFGTAASSVLTATVPADAVIVARTGFNQAEITATAYLRLPRCMDDGSNRPLCRDPAQLQRIVDSVTSGRSARRRLAALQRSNPGGNVPIADYNTLTQSTSIINDLTAAYRAVAGK